MYVNPLGSFTLPFLSHWLGALPYKSLSNQCAWCVPKTSNSKFWIFFFISYTSMHTSFYRALNFIFNYVCFCVWCVHMSVSCLWSEEGVRSLGAGVTRGFKLPRWVTRTEHEVFCKSHLPRYQHILLQSDLVSYAKWHSITVFSWDEILMIINN